MRQVTEKAKCQQPPLFDIVARVSLPRIESLEEEMKMSIQNLLSPLLQLNRKSPESFQEPDTKALEYLKNAMKEVRESWRREVQRRIAQALEIAEVQEEFALRRAISNALAKKRFLLIVEDVWPSINLTRIGIDFPGLTSPGSKIILAIQSDYDLLKGVDRLEEDWEHGNDLSKEEVWTLFHDESTDVAANLPKYSGIFTGDIVLKCFYYVSLFPSKVDENFLIECWRSEGFMDEFIQRIQAKDQEMAIAELGRALLKELAVRCMLRLTPATPLFYGNDIKLPDIGELVEYCSLQGSANYHVKMESHIREMMDSSRFLVRLGFSSSEKTSQALNLQDMEMISLARSNICIMLHGSDSLHPNCPKLSTLFLYGRFRPLQVIPDSFFQFMPRLRVLNLSHLQINSFSSSSITHLQKLRMLKLTNCGELEALPSFSQAWPILEVLDFEGTPLTKIQEASFENMHSLRRLDISSASEQTPRLSFRGCQALHMFDIGSQPNLQVLDLSDTVIKHFPSSMSTMKRLQELYLSFVNDRYGHFDKRQFAYGLVYAQTKRCSFFFGNHLEIRGGDNFPGSILMALSEKESLHLHNNCSIERLADMNGEHLGKLRECRIEKCSQMESIVFGQRRTDVLKSLQSLQVSDLAELTSICRGEFGAESFTCLKDIQLHFCPKLVYCFSSITCLGNLESLEIKFCGRLKKVFEEDGKKGRIAFPSLKKACLWQLPKLESICSGSLPKLGKLEIRGCSKLQKIPLQTIKGPNATSLMIRGEKKWWAKIKGNEELYQPHITFKPWRSFHR